MALSTYRPSSNSSWTKELTYYDVLGISHDVSTEEIRKAYKKQAKKFHPDKNPDDPNAKKKFQMIEKAYRMLTNEEAREAYDDGLSRKENRTNDSEKRNDYFENDDVENMDLWMRNPFDFRIPTSLFSYRWLNNSPNIFSFFDNNNDNKYKMDKKTSREYNITRIERTMDPNGQCKEKRYTEYKGKDGKVHSHEEEYVCDRNDIKQKTNNGGEKYNNKKSGNMCQSMQK